MKSCVSKTLFIAVSAISIIAVAYYFNTRSESLPVFSPWQVNPVLVDEDVRMNKKHRVAKFELFDQYGNITDSTFTEGNVHVADFFFTTCQTICPIMSGKMESVASQFDPTKDNLRFVSFTVIPEEDTVEALGAYAEAYGVNYDQWRLLTGAKETIYDLARKSYFTLKPAEVGQGDGGASDFIHTNNFVLVDSNQRLRGYYDGTSDADMKRLVQDLKKLLREEKKK